MAQSHLNWIIDTLWAKAATSDPGCGTLGPFLGLRLKAKGDQVFSIRAPQLGNDLSKILRWAESVFSFISLLQTHFCRLHVMSSFH